MAVLCTPGMSTMIAVTPRNRSTARGQNRIIRGTQAIAVASIWARRRRPSRAPWHSSRRSPSRKPLPANRKVQLFLLLCSSCSDRRTERVIRTLYGWCRSCRPAARSAFLWSTFMKTRMFISVGLTIVTASLLLAGCGGGGAGVPAAAPVAGSPASPTPRLRRRRPVSGRAPSLRPRRVRHHRSSR